VLPPSPLLLVKAGDLGGAKARFEDSLKIAERLAKQSAEAQRDVWVSMWRLAQLQGGGVTWAQVLAKLEEMKERGTLSPGDKPLRQQARAGEGLAYIR
jgi:hypothetical protein